MSGCSVGARDDVDEGGDHMIVAGSTDVSRRREDEMESERRGGGSIRMTKGVLGLRGGEGCKSVNY